MDDAQLRTIWQQRQYDYRIRPLSESVGHLVKHQLAKRVRKLSELAGIWDECIPSPIRDHTALEGFHRGVLTVLCDSASQRFRLQTLLAGGLMQEIQRRFSGALNKVRVVPGQFYSVDVETGSCRYEW
jgi:hypothetical protein